MKENHRSAKITVDLFNQLSRYVKRKTITRKPIYLNEFGRHGQICLFLNAYYPGINLQSNAEASGKWSLTPLVNYHFANLNLNEEPVVILSSGIEKRARNLSGRYLDIQY
jgi:hypothetical protein